MRKVEKKLSPLKNTYFMVALTDNILFLCDDKVYNY